MKAFSMGRFHKLVAVEGERVRGTFAVLLGQPGKPTYVKPFDVTVYDEGRHSGIVFYSGDMVGNVIDGVASIQERSITDSKRWDARDAWAELCDAIAAVVEIAEAEREENADG